MRSRPAATHARRFSLPPLAVRAWRYGLWRSAAHGQRVAGELNGLARMPTRTVRRSTAAARAAATAAAAAAVVAAAAATVTL